MPQPKIHRLVFNQSIDDVVASLTDFEKEILKLEGLPGSSDIARAFSFEIPDLFYFKDLIMHRHRGNYQKVSDVLHWERSFEMFSHMLNYIQNAVVDPKTRRKLKDFAYGFYSHVIVDAIFHPKVYRETNDHPFVHPAPAYREHKRYESKLDGYVSMLRNINPHEHGLPELLKYAQEIGSRGYDEGIFTMMNFAMAQTYDRPKDSGLTVFKSHDMDYLFLFEQYKKDKFHPFNDAVSHMISLFSTLYAPHVHLENFVKHHPIALSLIKSIPEVGIFAPLIALEPKHIREIESKDGKPWYDIEGTPSYTIMELYNMSVKATAKMIKESEKFFRSGQRDSGKFFEVNSKGVVYLHEINLDTGLHPKHNSTIRFIEPENMRRAFAVGLEELNEYYKSIINSTV